MNLRRLLILPIILVMTCSISAPAAGQQDALASITAEELRTHLTFIASDEMMGRDTPSPQLKLAARYLATMVESYGWKPIMPDGSFLQTIALETVSPSTSGTQLTAGGKTFRFPSDFGGRLSEGTTTGEMVFIGLGLEQPDSGWDDYAGIDVSGKDAVVGMEVVLPEEIILTVTNRGFGKRTRADAYPRHHRGGQGVKGLHITQKNGPVLGLLQLGADDEIMLVTDRGKIIPRRISATCSRHQRQLSVAIKHARYMALLPYVAE